MEGVNWRTVKDVTALTTLEQCEYGEAVAAAPDGVPLRYIDWGTGYYTFHRADRSTSGRQVKRGPKTIWLRQKVAETK